MTWTNRFKMLAGLLLVVALVALLTIVFSQRKGETTSLSGSVVAESYPVGSDYPGTVVEQFVEEGDEVVVGDPIATVQSTTLMQALENDVTVASTSVYDVHDDGTLTVKSTVNGVIDSIDVKQGGYAAGGSTIASIDATEALYVDAQYLLDPPDFARVEVGAEVRIVLPNSQRIDGTVRKIAVETDNGKAETRVEVESPDLVYGGAGIITPGTPVTATLQLRNQDPLAQAVDSVMGNVRGFVQTLNGWTA